MRPNPMVRRVLLAISLSALLPALAGAQQSSVPARITQAIDNSKLTVLKGNTHPLARPQFDRGPAPSNLPPNRMLLVLQRSAAQEMALEELLDQQQDKSSPKYHAWLMPDEFGQRFGPADQDIQTITNWLESQGFRVGLVAKGRTVIEFSGTAGQVKQAFHTEIHEYEVNGEKHWANAQDPQIPAALGAVVAAPVSLNNFRAKPMYHLVGSSARSKQTGQVQPTGPELTYTCGAQSCYPLAPYDFATIYNMLPLWNANPATDGTGQSIAIVGRTNINIEDVVTFRSVFGLPANAPQAPACQ